MNRVFPLKTILIPALLVLVVFQMSGQKTEKFFNHLWIECQPNVARFYRLVVKTDSGYCRKDFYLRERRLCMLGNYKDSLLRVETGKFYYFYPDGSPAQVGRYVNGRKEGVWLSFHHNKMLKDSSAYLQGNQHGTSLSWHPNGRLADSTYSNEDGSGYSASWFDNGSISSRGKYSAGHKQDGLWEYYHINGQKSSLETYSDSKLIDKKYFDESGVEMKDTTNHDRPARYSDNLQDWFNYLREKIYYPFNQHLVNGDEAVVVVDFIINEDGMPENVYTSTTFSEKFDREAENAIRESPQWLAAISHNRKVKYKTSQIVRFQDSKHR